MSDSVHIVISEAPVAGFGAPLTGCAPLNVNFINQSTGAVQYFWNLGDGNISTQFQPQHLYQNDGCYDIQLIVVNNAGCSDTMQATCGVQVFPMPEAILQVLNENVSELNPQVDFINNSIGNDSCYFYAGEGNIIHSCDQMYTHLYTAAGTYIAYLVVSNQYGCTDSVTVSIEVKPEPTLFVPNAFTPDSDGKNDYFTAAGYGIEDYQLLIFDRWGELLFQSDQISRGWDGTYRGYNAIEDVYIWKIQYKDNKGYIKNITGHVTLIR